MTHLQLNDHSIELDNEGYLRDLSQWSPQIAEALAAEIPLQLSDAHWEILYLLRDFYQRFEHAPAMRPLVKTVSLSLGPEKGRSIYLLKLFPDSPAKLAARLAGLPKPTNCL
ncbi:sulfur relay protein TusE [Marinobacterium aestuarii]|uniref:Sulfurtransferase n=1 Tax=Marinobacterium aestuarii TaxID=1821621 RepID=A0A1A9EY63_9GAMM|nr:TusE/DsrC/DsvC family sulfur relay protein [Marinobacterium aestuarii]ANG62680.1 sulfur relay protein TusE [Marinobacterium aestuarii]